MNKTLTVLLHSVKKIASISSRLRQTCARHIIASSLIVAIPLGTAGFAVATTIGAASTVSALSLQANSGQGVGLTAATLSTTKNHRGDVVLRLFFLHKAILLISKDTNQSTKAIRQQLKEGKSLATIAGSYSQSIQNELVSLVQTRLNRLVSLGKITQTQANNRLNMIRKQISKAMSLP